MQTKSKLVLGGALALVALVGCGGNSSGGEFTTSVPSGTKLTSLTPQQATQLCTDFENYATTTLTPDLCKLLAIEATALSLSISSGAQPSDATLRTTCTQTYDSCLSGGDGGITTTSSCDSSTLTSEPSTCTSTVGDLTMCVNASLTSTNQAVAALPSCSAVTAENLISSLQSLAAQADAGAPMSATCTALESNCSTASSSSSMVGLVTAARRLRK
jgi:hypothetical protein